MIISNNDILTYGKTIGSDLNTVQNKFGSNESVGTSFEDVWRSGGTLQFLTSAELIDIQSTDSTDADGNTGANTVEIQGLDNDFKYLSEIVTLDGTTPVQTVNSFIRINRAFVRNVGTGGKNAGVISMVATNSLTAQALIDAEIGQTEKTQFTVPVNVRCTIDGWFADAGKNDDFVVYLMTREFGESWRVRDLGLLYQNQIVRNLVSSVHVGPKSDIRIIAKSGSVNRPIVAGYIYYLTSVNNI